MWPSRSHSMSVGQRMLSDVKRGAIPFKKVTLHKTGLTLSRSLLIDRQRLRCMSWKAALRTRHCKIQVTALRCCMIDYDSVIKRVMKIICRFYFVMFSKETPSISWYIEGQSPRLNDCQKNEQLVEKRSLKGNCESRGQSFSWGYLTVWYTSKPERDWYILKPSNKFSQCTFCRAKEEKNSVGDLGVIVVISPSLVCKTICFFFHGKFF